MRIIRYHQLNETQKFSFDTNKEQIIKFINKVKKGEQLHQFDNPFYSVITGERKFTNLFSDDIKKKWRDFFFSNSFNSDGVWSERRFNSKLKRNSGNDRTYNYYITIDKDSKNIQKFLSNLNKLDSKLQELSNNIKQPIAYKTHTILDMMVNHNDSLKIYFYDGKIKDNIENIVKEWVIENNIALSNRSHTFGVDMKVDGEKTSYGDILSKIVAKQFEELIKKYGNKYSTDSYYDWIKNNMANIIKNVKVDYTK